MEKLSDEVAKIYLVLDLDVVDTNKASITDTLLELNTTNADVSSTIKTKKKRVRKNRVEKRMNLAAKRHERQEEEEEALPPPPPPPTTTTNETIESKIEVKIGVFLAIL